MFKKFIASGIGILAVAALASARPVVVVSGNYPITAANCDGDIIARGGQFNITLPAPIANCDLNVINDDSGNGKTLVNFPADVNPKLYPQQMLGITSDGTSWSSKHKPGRYRLPPGVVVHVDPAGLDTNDGLTPATAIASGPEATRMVQQDFDKINTPTIAVKGGTTNTTKFWLGGQMVSGGNLAVLAVYGSGQANITFAGPPVLAGDGGWWLIDPIALGAGTSLRLTNTSNVKGTSNEGVLYCHNDGGFDVSNGQYLTLVGTGTVGSATNGAGYFFDGSCVGASANSTNFEGVFGDVISALRGAPVYTFGGTLAPVQDAGGVWPWGDRLFAIGGQADIIMGGQPTMTNWRSLGTSTVTGSGILRKNGASVPGSAIIPTENGFVEP